MREGNVAIIIWFIIIFGWGRNLYKLAQCNFDVPLKTEVIRCVGVPLFPLGAIIGYMDIGEE